MTTTAVSCLEGLSQQVLALRNSYHGRSYAAMGVTGNRTWSPSGLSPFTVSFLHSGDRLRGTVRGFAVWLHVLDVDDRAPIVDEGHR